MTPHLHTSRAEVIVTRLPHKSRFRKSYAVRAARRGPVPPLTAPTAPGLGAGR